MGIPAIIGVGNQMKPEYEGREVILDGNTGNVVVEADEATKSRLLLKMEEQKKQQELLNQLKGLPMRPKTAIRSACTATSAAPMMYRQC